MLPVVILCGGRGTRLQEHTRSIPKPLVEIGGRPIVWHVIQLYAVQGFHDFVLCTGYDFMPGSFIPYTTNLPLARAVDDDVLLVHTWEGKPLPREHGGPLRMITPKLYAWKGAKWIRKIEFLAEDKKGFWEVRGYSNSAEPWFNDRYATE